MTTENNNIQHALYRAIEEAHHRAEETTVEARGSMDTAINNRIMCASLIEKAKQLHKQDLAGYLEFLTGSQIKAYLSLHDAASKRPAIHDKRQLMLCGILEASENTHQERTPQPPPSVISTSSNFIGKFNKAISRRPVEEWQDGERQQVKDVLKPVVEFYNSL